MKQNILYVGLDVDDTQYCAPSAIVGQTNRKSMDET